MAMMSARPAAGNTASSISSSEIWPSLFVSMVVEKKDICQLRVAASSLASMKPLPSQSTASNICFTAKTSLAV